MRNAKQTERVHKPTKGMDIRSKALFLIKQMNAEQLKQPSVVSVGRQELTIVMEEMIKKALQATMERALIKLYQNMRKAVEVKSCT